MIARLLAASALLGALSSAALAADLAPPPVYPPPPPVFTWTGVYVGGQIGYQWGESQNPYVYADADPGVPVFPLQLSHTDEGIVGGAHVGYNWQISQFVIGLEGDVNGSDYQGTSTYPYPTASFLNTESTRIGIEGSVRGRVGFAWDRVLIYGTGGVAFASINNSVEVPVVDAYASASTGRVGWTAGGGIEYAIDNNWSIRAEYRYTDYGNVSYAFPSTSVLTGYSVSKCITDNMATGGFSYKFDMFAPPAPVVAKY
jgi:outer membrane immunogenic protein